MLQLFEFEEYIYCNTKWNERRKTRSYVYDHLNKLYPNKKYNISHMKWCNIIHFGNDYYRNNNKLIFDGVKLVDDYDSLHKEYVVSENPWDFNIGDFNRS